MQFNCMQLCTNWHLPCSNWLGMQVFLNHHCSNSKKITILANIIVIDCQISSNITFSFTVTATGFLNPALAKDSTSRVCVAEKRPVRRCFGRNPNIVFRVA